MMNSLFLKIVLRSLLGLGMSGWVGTLAIANPHPPQTPSSSRQTPNPSALCTTVQPLSAVIQPLDSIQEPESLDPSAAATHSCADDLAAGNLTELSSSAPSSTITPEATPEANPEKFPATFPESIPPFNPRALDIVVKGLEPPSSAIAQAANEPAPEETDSPQTPNEASASEENPTPWRFSIMPYATIPVTLYGTNVIRGRDINYSAGLGTILDKLKVVVSARAEAWNGNFGLIVDGYYVSLGGTGFQEIRRPIADINITSNLSFEQGIYDFALSYHLGDIPVAYDPKKPSNRDFPLIWFQPIIGTRLNQLDSTLNTTVSFNRLNRTFEDTVSAGRTWFEPLLGGKLGVQVSDPLTLWLRGDASGFGLAGETDLSWNLFLGADWWINRSLSLSLSYRFYEIDYGNGTGDDAFRFNQNFNGPTLAATFHF